MKNLIIFLKILIILNYFNNNIVDCENRLAELIAKPTPPPCTEETCKNGVCLKNNTCECNKDYRTTFKIGHIELCNERIDKTAKEKCSLQNCVNGICSVLNECQCLAGFAIAPTMDHSRVVCEKIADITGTVISLVFGIPLCLTTIGLIIFCICRRKTNARHINSIRKKVCKQDAQSGEYYIVHFDNGMASYEDRE